MSSFPPRTILHVDMDAFFASVEQQDHPEYRGQPLVVGSPPDVRGVVAAASYEARKFGIHSAMPSRTAYQKCPTAIFMPGNMARYKEVSRQIMQVFQRFTPWVQPLSIDEAFLDVSGAHHLFGSGETMAQKIRNEIRNETGLTASVGVAPNMFLAKLASDMDKPDGLTVVPFEPKAIEIWLAPLSIKRLWGAGKVTQRTLFSHQLKTLGDLQKCSTEQLESLVGKRAAATFSQLCRGIDSRQIETDTEEKSISNEYTFKKDCTDRCDIEQTLLRLIDKVATRLRKAEKFATTVHLKIRWEDFSTITRQIRLSLPSRDDFTLREEGMALFQAHYKERPIRLIGFGVSGLTESERPTAQLDLFEMPDTTLHQKRHRLASATDQIRDAFGSSSLRRGSDLDRKE